VSFNAAPPGSNRTGQVILAVGYLCMVVVLVNVAAKFGWIHVRLPFLTGFGARWGWALGAFLCFIVAWYLERGGRNRPT
jgi:hypothetical protein